MAAISYASDFGARLESVNKMLHKIAEHSAPLVARHLDLSRSATKEKHEWVDKRLKGYTANLVATIVTATTVITLSGGTNAPKAIVDGVTRLLIGGEQLLVTSTITVVTNAINVHVSRGIRSTTATGHNANKNVIILNTRAEGFTADRDDSDKGARRFNYTTIKETQLVLTGTAQAIDTVGNEQTLGAQRADKMGENYKSLEISLLYDSQYQSGNERTAGGFYWWATNYGATNTNVGGAITKDIFEEVTENYIKAGGDATQLVALCSVKQQRQINELKAARVVGGGQSQKETNLNDFVDTFNFGTKANIEIMYHPDVRDDEIYFYQKDSVKVIPLKGRAFKPEKLAKTGDTDREMIVGEYTFEFFNPTELLHRYEGLTLP